MKKGITVLMLGLAFAGTPYARAQQEAPQSGDASGFPSVEAAEIRGIGSGGEMGCRRFAEILRLMGNEAIVFLPTCIDNGLFKADDFRVRVQTATDADLIEADSVIFNGSNTWGGAMGECREAQQNLARLDNEKAVFLADCVSGQDGRGARLTLKVKFAK